MASQIAPLQWAAISAAALRDETTCLRELCAELSPHEAGMATAEIQARQWIEQLRERGPRPLGIEALLQEYRLDTPEGVALMCLAEALLRIPDAAVADALIHDLLSPIAWRGHLGHSADFFVNAASWGLALTGRWLTAVEQPGGDLQGWLRRIAARAGEPVLRQALRQAMRFLAGQFVLGESLETALARAEADWQLGCSHSFDMLGEAALAPADSARYLSAYRDAIEHVGHCCAPAHIPRPSVSIKLSALHPRYCTAQLDTLRRELLPDLRTLCALAAQHHVDLAIDAEETDRLELSLQLLAELFARIDAPSRGHVGIVVQAYSKRALAVLHWLRELARHYRVRVKVRLVKGAYWDSEIKRAQQRGLPGYPVFTDKAATDISYLACAQFLLRNPREFFAQFATHNAVTMAAIIDNAGTYTDFEFQRLQGMGEALHARVREQHPDLAYRIYAPVGEHRELLPYLVRRLLENGANTSFIHQLFDPRIPIDVLARHPLQEFLSSSPLHRSTLPLPADLFQPERSNSPGIDLHNAKLRDSLFAAIHQHAQTLHDTGNITVPTTATPVRNPATGQLLGYWQPTSPAQLAHAMTAARASQPAWEQIDVAERTALIERCADQFIAHRAELVALIVAETGKTIDNALDEIREAVDFCRYYAAQAQLLHAPRQLPGPVGENNQLWLRPRGIFACISPWNFPLAIFTGQIVAALATGNAVLAKPAEQATLTAQRALALMHAAGIPENILHPICGDGTTIGAALCAQADLDGVVFTGGFDTARAISQQLAARHGAIIPFIAETAGLNCLIADSSAQPQQLVQDVMRSAFDSAGQRCSALRVLYLPKSCAQIVEALLIGAMQTLQLGNPLQWNTDIGPVIDTESKQSLHDHIEHFRGQGRVLFQCDDTAEAGYFVPPTLIRLSHLDELSREAFGPILHVIRYDADALDAVITEINRAGFGLTCGIHSRNIQHAQDIAQRLRVGNCYINRDMIGAVVGAQPFGGCGKSGTGPKAGGPHYLLRFVTEQTITINTAAIGGDARLLARRE